MAEAAAIPLRKTPELTIQGVIDTMKPKERKQRSKNHTPLDIEKLGLNQVRTRIKDVLTRTHALSVRGDRERVAFTRAYRDFTGTLPAFRGPDDEGNYTFEGLPKDAVVTFLEHNGEKWNEPFFDFLAKQLPPHDQERLIHFSENRRIMMMRRTKAAPEFKTAVQEHAEQEHHGALSFTEIQLARSHQNGNGHSESMDAVLASAKNTLKFYPLAAQKGIAPLFKHLNDLADPYELEYNALMTIRELTNSKNKLSGGLVASGPGMEQGLEHVSALFGDQASQVASQVVGEIMAMGVAAADRLPLSYEKRTFVENMQRYFGIAGQIIRRLPQNTQQLLFSQGEQYAKARSRIAQRGLVLALTAGSTFGLSELSQYVNNLAPYSIIPFMNTSIITAYEMYERTKEYKNVKMSGTEFDALLARIPAPLQPLFRKLPQSTTLAYSDFVKNKYAVGSLAGSFLATMSVLPLDQLGVSREWIYSIAGVMAENTTALVYGTLANKKDVYDQFLKTLES